MKKELIYYSSLTIVIASLLLFEPEMFSFKLKKASKVMDIEAFEKLQIDLACNIYVSIGDEQRIVFEGPERNLKLVETNFDNGTLKIKSKRLNAFSRILGLKESKEKSLNIYIKLTDTDQLIVPKKGNLISNETSLYVDIAGDERLSIHHNLRDLFKILGRQLGNTILS